MSLFGKTALGLPIPIFNLGKGQKTVLILGGVHGDEPEGVVAAFGLLGSLTSSIDSFPHLRFDIIPQFNLDGLTQRTRANGNGVDLNRNLPTRDWDPKAFNDRYPPGPHANSESENQALVKYLEKETPRLVLSLHSFRQPLLNVNGDCEKFAAHIEKKVGYPVVKEMGYPTPGCLGTFAGLERQMPTLTYELLRGMPPKEILSIHVPAIIEAFSEIS